MSTNPTTKQAAGTRVRRPYDRLTPLTRRLKKTLKNIEGRCGRTPGVNNFAYYGGRGIKNFLTLDDLCRLWERDGAEKMAQPSIDRKDATEHYTFENCRFIEFTDNCKGADHRLTCSACSTKITGIIRGLCANCRPQHRCRRCGAPTPQRVCNNCRFETRPCGWCGQPIKRDIVAKTGRGTRTNKQWFCSKQEQGEWLGYHYGSYGGRNRWNGAAQEAAN